MPAMTRIPGSANRFMCPARSNSNVVGCRRCSDGIAGSRRKEMLADLKRAAVLEPVELDLRMLGARRVDHERAQTIAALDRSLRHVDVLHARARDVDHDSPVDAFADFNAVIVHAIEGVLIGARRPTNRVPESK